MSKETRHPQLAHWGAYTAVVKDGRLIRCEPFAEDPDPSAMLDSIVPMVYSDKRIRRPAVRRSWLASRERADGTLRGREDFVEIDWEHALRLVAGEIARVRERHGPSGLFTGSYGWSSAGRLHHARSLIRRFYFKGGGGVDQVGNYSWGAAQFLLPYVIGSHDVLTGRVTTWPSIIEHTEVFLAFGGLSLHNAQVSSGGAAEHSLKPWLEKLAASRAKVINISPMRDDCPAFVNAEWIPIRPNTDVALMLALAGEILRQGAHDTAFLSTRCTGYAQLEAYLTGSTDAQPKTPEWASAITGIPAERIRRLAGELTGVRSFMTAAYSLQRAHRGEQPYWMLIALASMLGQIGRPGGGFAFGHGSMNGVGNPRVATPGPEMAVGKNPSGLSIPVARLSDMLLKPGAPYRFRGETHHYPDIHLIHWAGGNPFHHHQQLNRLLQGWQKPETVIVQDIWWTAAAKHADIVLPVTTSLERNDIGGSSRDPYVLAMHRAIAPQHQARSDFDIFSELAERLCYRETFTEGRDETAWIRAIYEQCGQAQRAAGIDWPEFETFWERGHVRLPRPDKDFIFLEDYCADPEAHPLATPSGKIELFSATIAGYADTDIGGHPEWRAPAEWLGAAQTAEFPLHLISIQPRDRLHSQLDPAPAVQANKTAGVETLYLHPADALARGIASGDKVCVFNARGSTQAGVVLSDGLTPGVVIMSTGAWFDPDYANATLKERAGNPNVLTLDIGTSELTQGANAMSCLVEIRRDPLLPP